MLPLIFSYSAQLTNDGSSISILIVRLLTFLILFLVIIGVAYFVSKYVGNTSRNFINQKNLKVLEKITLGIEKSIYLINLDSQYYIITTTKNNIQLIDKLDKNSINIKDHFENKKPANTAFSEYLDKYLGSNNKDKDNNASKPNPLNVSLIQKLADIKKLNSELRQVKQEVNKDENK